MSRHTSEQRIQRARTQPIAVPVQLLQHPVSIHALLLCVMQDVNLPKGEQELASDSVAHDCIASYAAGLTDGALCFTRTVVPDRNSSVPRSAISSPVLRRSEEHTSELQSQSNLVCRLL